MWDLRGISLIRLGRPAGACTRRLVLVPRTWLPWVLFYEGIGIGTLPLGALRFMIEPGFDLLSDF